MSRRRSAAIPIVIDGVVYVGSEDGSMHALNPTITAISSPLDQPASPHAEKYTDPPTTTKKLSQNLNKIWNLC